jgi:hypothetical protein
MNKIEKEALLLGKWQISIYRGVLTGFNKAFLITSKTKSELYSKDQKYAELLRPLLRGRDVQKWSYEFQGVWLIKTLPSLKINIDSYPAIKEYLLSFGLTRLEQSGDAGSRKKTHNKWFETQDSISYWEDFEKPKIIWGEISDKPKFAYEDSNFYAEATTFIMTGEKLLIPFEN